MPKVYLAQVGIYWRILGKKDNKRPSSTRKTTGNICPVMTKQEKCRQRMSSDVLTKRYTCTIVKVISVLP
jgi:hypothetical protein